MSATIYWKPVTHDDKALNVPAPSAFIAAMERAFGAGPWVLGATAVSKLEGMAAAYSATPNPFEQLLDKIQNDDGTYTTIEVWAVY